MKQLYILALIGLFGGFPAFAQEPGGTSSQPADSSRDRSTRIVVGSVLDADDGMPLVGASVSVLEADSAGNLLPNGNGAVTDVEGTFRIVEKAGQQLTLNTAYVGYRKAWSIVPPDRDTVLVEMKAEDIKGEVTVTAVRRSRSVEDACCRVESIQEEVQQHAPFSPSATDVLRRYSSCTSLRIDCAFDNSSSIRLRGLEPTRISVMVDGMPSFSGLSTFYGLGMLPAHALQTIRISEGASGSLSGNGAISGVVSLETRPPTEEPELSLSGNLAGDGPALPGERDFNLAYTGMIDDVGIAAFGSFNSHGHGGPDDPHERGYQRFAGVLKGNMLLDRATELTVTALGGNEVRSAGLHSDNHPDYQEEIALNRLDLMARLGHTFENMSDLTLDLMASNTGADGTFGATEFEGTQRVLYGGLTYRFDVGDHLPMVGAQIRNDALTEQSNLGIGYDLTVASLHAEDQWFFAERWTLLTALRLDHHSAAGSILSPRASVRYEPITNMTMRLMAGQGFKGEALFDEEHLLLHGLYRWQSNEDLDFETSFTWNYDISYSFLLGDQVGIDANFNAYYTAIRNKMVPQDDSLAQGTLFFINSDRPARLTGIEIQARPTFGERWSGSLALALINYALQGTDGEYRQLPLAPQANVDASLLYHDPDAQFTAEVWGSLIGAQKLPENPLGLEESTPYTVLNLRAAQQFGIVEVFAGVINLLDARQTATMPLFHQVDETAWDGGTVWGPTEGREFFLGAVITIGGSRLSVE